MSAATGCATGIDHVGVVVPDLAAAASAWRALGFAPMPPARHLADGTATGTGNCNIMLGRGYIELLATIDPARPSATLALFLARHPGIQILTLATDDEALALTRLVRAGFSAAIARSSRAADPAMPDGPAAHFARIALTDDAPRLQLLRHLTPELVWQDRFLVHPNAAVALDAVIIAADPPAAFAARLSRAAGRPVMPDPQGGAMLTLGQAMLRVLPAAALGQVLPGVLIPALPFVAGVVVRTGDGNRAVARLLPQSRPVGDCLLAEASGVAVLFRP